MLRVVEKKSLRPMSIIGKRKAGNGSKDKVQILNIFFPQ